ncbi:pancreatic lipase-related protein 2 [Homalodisca vitripennis]|uniref:pancreatic lipase-related protein 2 n=1 Tax=Homalodisca vitripennis TaxID=197043 RepID=UPI001EEAAA08|nr:pancreatic lipase-related protein 2 [Homalodisca vitripennis]XP_046664367.1 pancreatic lipase-related protein 2 [Homalodisca vitripennis]
MVESAGRLVAAVANWLPTLAAIALMTRCGVTGQDEFKEVKHVGDLWNTSSCIEPPFACPHPRIQFFLYTRYTQATPDLLDTTDPNSLYASHFNPSHPTKVIIHGFQGGRNLAPSTDLRDAYFKRGNYNIIIVDYSTLVKLPCLSQMEWSPRFCAQCIAQMVDYLAYHPRGVVPDTLHLMGYSIGAHIAGLTANFVQEGKLGRITGLDPTIIFYMANNRSKDLDPSDAHFVDVIHTGAGVLGQWGPNGHADFYVNGGTSQPGCTSNSIIKTLSCDHTKVTPYFIESINSEAGFWSVPCSNRFLFMLGFCNPPAQDWVLMGEHANPKIRGIFYLTTNANPPYAQGLPGRFRPKPSRQQRQSRKT